MEFILTVVIIFRSGVSIKTATSFAQEYRTQEAAQNALTELESFFINTNHQIISTITRKR